mmetsp:Transcript_69971/g.216339  ORF Transcript_69971/g.216339 Transcript_69971/m.216339 type:complete len:167 (-) Transcript_69971:135-635(-)
MEERKDVGDGGPEGSVPGSEGPVSEVASEDAPPGHPAYSRVRFCEHAQGHLYHFKYGEDHFQVTLGRACNSAKHAARIARLCYVRFEAGSSKEDVKAYRDQLLRDLARSWASNKDKLEGAGAEVPKAPRVPKRRGRRDGAVGESWASQLGTRFSKMRKLADPFGDL